MTERVQVVVEAKDAASGVLRGITSQFGALGSAVEELTGSSINWGNVIAVAGQAAIDYFKEAFKVATEYAASVRDLSLASGASAEESSRLLQVLDDFEISAENVTAATRIMTKNGLAPTIETVAKLSDEYLSLNTAQERNKFILDNLGRGGADWMNVLKEGSAAILEMNDSVSDALILNDEQIAQYEEMRLNQDEFNGNLQEIQMTLINGIVPAVNETVNAFQTFANAQEDLEQKGYSAYEAHRLTMMGFYDVGDAAKFAGKAQDDLATSVSAAGDAAADVANTDYKKLLDMTLKLNDATIEQIQQMAFQDLYKQMADDVNGLTEAERDMLNEIGVELGIFDQKAVETSEQIYKINEAFIQTNLSVYDYIEALNAIPTTVSTTITNDGGVPPPSGYNPPVEYAEGTGGYVKVPPGYPNDTYTVGLSSGEIFDVKNKRQQNESVTGGVQYFYGNTTFIMGDGGGDFMESR